MYDADGTLLYVKKVLLNEMKYLFIYYHSMLYDVCE